MIAAAKLADSASTWTPDLCLELGREGRAFRRAHREEGQQRIELRAGRVCDADDEHDRGDHETRGP